MQSLATLPPAHISTGRQGLGEEKNLAKISLISAYDGEFAGLIRNHDMIGHLEFREIAFALGPLSPSWDFIDSKQVGQVG
jgi:hypothetical protein